MTVLSIPPLDPELESMLLKIVTSKKYSERSEPQWSNDFLPKIMERLNTIEHIASNYGEKFSTRPEGVNLPESIKYSKDRVIKHLDETFPNRPPFTIQRIAELLLNPTKEGYVLANNVQILKFFNSLSKLVLVSSSVFDFPPVTIHTSTAKESTIIEMNEAGPTSQLGANIPLIEIPWLKINGKELQGNVMEDKEDKECDLDANNSSLDPMIISPPPQYQEEINASQTENGADKKTATGIPKSPGRRRRESDDDELNISNTENEDRISKKRPKKDQITSPITPPNKNESPGEEEDKMDISTCTFEDLSTSSRSTDTPTKTSKSSDSIVDESERSSDSETTIARRENSSAFEDKMDISSENLIISDEEPLVH